MQGSPLRTVRAGYVIQDLAFPSTALFHFSRYRVTTCGAKNGSNKDKWGLEFVYAHRINI